MKKLIVFDLDGTLAESKAALDNEMTALLETLLGIVPVAIISGGSWTQFEQQVLTHLKPGDYLTKLSLLPTCGTQFYTYGSAWQKRYSEDFTDEEKVRIIDALNRSVDEAGLRATQTWGDLIEDRGSQITFSGLGQQAPLEQKRVWDPDYAKRKAIKSVLDQALPDVSVRLGGATSIDITKPGIDKAYGIRKLRDILGIGIPDMLFLGDALFPGGNDYPAKTAGAHSIQVRDPTETKRIVDAIIACVGD